MRARDARRSGLSSRRVAAPQDDRERAALRERLASHHASKVRGSSERGEHVRRGARPGHPGRTASHGSDLPRLLVGRPSSQRSERDRGACGDSARASASRSASISIARATGQGESETDDRQKQSEATAEDQVRARPDGHDELRARRRKAGQLAARAAESRVGGRGTHLLGLLDVDVLDVDRRHAGRLVGVGRLILRQSSADVTDMPSAVIFSRICGRGGRGRMVSVRRMNKRRASGEAVGRTSCSAAERRSNSGSSTKTSCARDRWDESALYGVLARGERDETHILERAGHDGTDAGRRERDLVARDGLHLAAKLDRAR